MNFRKFGAMQWNASILGFGCMRLPTLDKDPLSPDIDKNESVRMIRHAIDAGVNYIDTAYPYHGGNSEIVTGEALLDGYRSRVKLATKLPMWKVSSKGDFDTILSEQLKKLQTDHIDMYLFHALNEERWNTVLLKHDLIAAAERARQSGKIGAIGFSFHDRYAVFESIIDAYKWDFCQIILNYLSIDHQAGMKGLWYAAERKIPVIVMEPLLGGKLANPPTEIQELFDNASIKRYPAQSALNWVWNQKDVSVVLSGMSNMQQVSDNLMWASTYKSGTIDEEEYRLIAKAQELYRNRIKISCTKCGYCMPCPAGVDIPRNFEVYNNGYIHNSPKSARQNYQRFVEEQFRAERCVECRKCEEKCPQQLPISSLMKSVHEELVKPPL